ncbi:hypothetical protein R8Z50_22095 [Longispora sp. K20-0274]|uniref:hypothetical protein n=1 Tax=Longispora sp. K20-0274 TaxID=3088255 RepID=UPI00399AE3BF
MTRRSIYFPEDVDAELDALGEREVSGFVTELVREGLARRRMREALTAAGYPVYPVNVDASAAHAAGIRRAAGDASADADHALATELGIPVAEVRARYRQPDA